jgi:hypothetical protein
MTRLFKSILKGFRSGRVRKKIATGKVVYFENPLEVMAFKYTPGEFNKPGKYYAKFYSQDEFEIGSDSTSVLMGVMEGNEISKERYNSFHLIPAVGWNRKTKTSTA